MADLIDYVNTLKVYSPPSCYPSGIDTINTIEFSTIVTGVVKSNAALQMELKSNQKRVHELWFYVPFLARVFKLTSSQIKEIIVGVFDNDPTSDCHLIHDVCRCSASWLRFRISGDKYLAMLSVVQALTKVFKTVRPGGDRQYLHSKDLENMLTVSRYPKFRQPALCETEATKMVRLARLRESNILPLTQSEERKLFTPFSLHASKEAWIGMMVRQGSAPPPGFPIRNE